MTEPLPILILPSWRYHATQGGKIYRTREELDGAEASGWRDSPAAAKAAAEALPVIEAMPDDGVAEEAKVVAKRRKR